MKVYYLKHNIILTTRKGVNLSMSINIITPYELGKISVRKVIIYLRKSRSEGKESVEEVLARHEKILQDHAVQTFGSKIPEENIYREVVSGETIDERVEIQKVFQRLEKEEGSVLLVVEPQRISRGEMLDCGRVVQILKYTNTIVATITKAYDLNNKFDKEIFESQLLQGNKYLEYTKEILDRGRQLSLREGKWVASTPPFGYARKALDRGFMLVKDQNEAPIVEALFSAFVDDGLSTLETAHYLNKHEMKPRIAKQWNDEMVRHILKNEVYYGANAWGKRPVVKKLINGELHKYRPNPGDYMLVRGRQEAIVPKEKWDMAQEKLKRNRPTKTGWSRELKNPLAGLVFCKKCGYSMVRVQNRRRKEIRRTRRYKVDKVAINKLIREHREKKGCTYQEIADFLGVSKTKINEWFRPNPEKLHYTDLFSEKWYELKFFLEIETDKYDKQLLTYEEKTPGNDTLMCSNQNCDMVSCVLQKLEERVLNLLANELKDFKFYVDNYEEEIIKERRDVQKTILKLEKKLDGLKTERKNLLRTRNREEISYDDYLELKEDIEMEIKSIETKLSKFENTEEEEKLIRYKKAIPKLEECLNDYGKMTIPKKNESLKSRPWILIPPSFLKHVPSFHWRLCL